MPLEYFYDENKYDYEICIDEVGRGCLFGDVVVSSVVLPKPINPDFDIKNIKDSKKFSNKTKLYNECDNIIQHVYYHHTSCIGPNVIDDINILQAVMNGMHKCSQRCIEYILANDAKTSIERILLVIDGNYFQSFEYNNNIVDHVTVKQGDGKYVGIAAASILAKTQRDKDIHQLCEEYPILNERYKLAKNVGYGTKDHMSGIDTYGITQWHRRSFGRCKIAPINEIPITIKSDCMS